MAKLKLTRDMINKICEAIRMGVPVIVACRSVGITTDTYYRWLKYGKERKSKIYSDFSDALEEAEAEAEKRLAQILYQFSFSDWRAALEILKRRFRDRWSDNIELTHEGNIKFDFVSEDVFRKVINGEDENGNE